MVKQKYIRMGIPSNERLFGEIKAFLNLFGFHIPSRDRSLYKEIEFNDYIIQLFYLRAKDIPAVLTRGYLDIGFSTDGHLYENDLTHLQKIALGFGEHRFVIASHQVKKKSELAGTVVATPYPHMTRRFFEKQHIPIGGIVYASGSVEVYPKMGMADAIMDITQTGISLKENGLTEVCEICTAGNILIVHPMSAKQKGVQQFIQLIEKGITK